MSETKEWEIGSGFSFSGTIIDGLDASEYTLVTIALDETGSISGLERQIEDMLKAAVGACFSSPYSQNLLVRVIRFGTQYGRGDGGGINEIHGFKALSEIDIDAYPALRAGGTTPLNDAVYSSVGAMNVYAQELRDLDFAVNGITFVITDGGENASVATTKMVKEELAKSVQGEIMESHHSILIGINTRHSDIQAGLAAFQQETGMSQFIWADDATPSKLAKLAQFISRSITNTSQALGTGGPSRNISATI